MTAQDCKRPRRDLTKDDFRSLELSISGQLEDHDLHALKYLCLDRHISLGYGQLEKCENGLDLFGKLEELTVLSNTNLDLLIELLYLIRRIDLKDKVEEKCGTFEVKKTISSYRRMVLELTYGISTDDLDCLKKTTLRDKLDRRVIAKLNHPIQMMYTLEKQCTIACDNVEYLTTIFKHLKRQVFAKIVLDYQQEVLMGRYKMDSKPRGLCIIINNINFSESCALVERKGSEKDQRKLKNTFETNLGFTVMEKINLTAEEINKLVKDAGEKDHTEYDCFVCCILSHGNSGVVTGVDGKTCKIMDIARYVSSSGCPTLVYKPKVFFIQACQGPKHDEKFDPQGVDYFTSTANEGGDNKNSMSTVDNDPREESRFIPDDADFLFAYASSPGRVAKLNMESGSVYINKLTEVLDKHHKDLDILSMLTLVNKEVCKVDLDGPNSKHKVVYGQAPAPQFTLRKKLYFN